jgi:hypothetical protein
VRRNVYETEPMRPVHPQNRKDDGKLWPEYGAGCFCPICSADAARRNPRWRAASKCYGGPHGTPTPSIASEFLRGQKTVTDMVDIEQSYGLYTTPHWRAAAWRDGAPAKLLTDSGDRSPTVKSGARASTVPRFPGRGSCTPGCLTGESEERETWTAGSLRVAWNEVAALWFAIIGKQLPCHAAGRDFGGTRFRSTPDFVRPARAGSMKKVGPRQTL